MSAYNFVAQDTNTAATTIGSLSQPASALKRLKMFYVSLASDATADNAFEVVFRRTTAAGTSTATVNTALDSADGAASGVSGQAHTVEPTYTANADVLGLSGHQRSTVQWYAQPGSEIVIPVTNSAGVGCLVQTVTSAFNQVMTVQYSE